MGANLRVVSRDPVVETDLPPDLPSLRVADAERQVAASVTELDRDGAAVMRWPWDDLDALTGPLGGGGDVWIVAAFSGSGKTTFVCSAIERWSNAGKRVYVMPLETQPQRFRSHLACLALELYPGDVLSGQLRNQAGGEAIRRALKDALREQTRSPFVDRVVVDEQRLIGLAGLEEGMRRAKSFGAHVVLIDHIDHIEGGNGSNAVADSKAVCYRALALAQANDMLLVLTSQLNMEIVRGGDRMSKYNAPQLHHLLYPGIKTQIATGIIGLYRPQRGLKPLETPKEFAEASKLVREGIASPTTLLEPFTMGVAAMKLRHYGAREGDRIRLGFANGKLVDSPTPEMR